jgi:hypothetical protein
MQYEFRWGPRFSEDRELIYELAFDINEKKGPVRLEIPLAFAADVWGFNRKAEASIKRKFDKEKVKFLARMETMASDDYERVVALRIGVAARRLQASPTRAL